MAAVRDKREAAARAAAKAASLASLSSMPADALLAPTLLAGPTITSAVHDGGNMVHGAGPDGDLPSSVAGDGAGQAPKQDATVPSWRAKIAAKIKP